MDKLCALSGYQTVTTAMVAEMGTVSLEADVFEMIRMITAKNATGACKKLQTLLRLQQEPIPITAAMIGSYVDLYRVKLGAAKRKSYSTVFKDFGYKGREFAMRNAFRDCRKLPQQFLRRALEGGTLEEALSLAAAASALAVSRPGAADAVSGYEEVLRIL